MASLRDIRGHPYVVQIEDACGEITLQIRDWSGFLDRHPSLADLPVRWVAVHPDQLADESPTPTPVSERRRLIAQYCAVYGISRTELAARAMVHDRDLRRWTRGDLSDQSVKSARIERVLRSP